MIDIDLLENLGIIVVSVAALVLLTRRLRIPNIVLYIVAGLVLGPLIGLLEYTHAIEIIAEVGIALLLFLVGLELSIAKIKDVGKVAVAAGIGQVVFTALGGFGITLLLGFTVIESIFIATALTFSSTVVVVKLLNEKDELTDLYGRIAVGIFLVQDIVVVIALTFLAGLAHPEDLEFFAALESIGLAFAGMILLLVVALLASRYVLPYLFSWLARSQEAVFIWAIFWCFLLVLGAEAMELSVEIGAFLAGIALAQLPDSHDLRRRVHPLVNFFIAVFFVSLGIQMELQAAVGLWFPAIILSLFVLIGNPFIFMVIISRLGYSERTSFLTSVTVAQISEFSFIFAALGLTTGLIDETILSLIAVVGLVTIGISSYMILFNHELYEVTRRIGIIRLFGASDIDEEEEDEAPLPADHIIVVGMNTMGRRLVNHLHETGAKIVAIDNDRKKLDGLPVQTLHGDAIQEQVLVDANLKGAKLLISALNIEETNNLLAYRCKELGIPCSIHAFDRSVVDDLKTLGVDYLIHSKREGAKQFLQELKDRQVVRT